MLLAIGGSAARGNLDAVPATVSEMTTAPDQAQALLAFNADGTVDEVTSAGGAVEQGDWLVNGGPGAFDLVVEVNSGALQVGAAGQHNLASGYQFGCQRDAVGTSSANVTLRLRRAGGSTDLDTATVDLSAQQS